MATSMHLGAIFRSAYCSLLKIKPKPSNSEPPLLRAICLRAGVADGTWSQLSCHLLLLGLPPLAML